MRKNILGMLCLALTLCPALSAYAGTRENAPERSAKAEQAMEEKSDTWAGVPTDVHAAVGELGKEKAALWYVDDYDNSRAVLLLETGAEHFTVCILHADDKGSWTLVGTNDNLIVSMEMDEMTQPVWFGVDGRLSIWYSLDDDINYAYGVDTWFTYNAESSEYELKFYRNISAPGDDEPIYEMNRQDGGYMLRTWTYLTPQETTMLYHMPSLTLDDFDSDAMTAFIEQTVKTRNDMPDLPDPADDNPLPSPVLAVPYKDKKVFPYSAPAGSLIAGKSRMGDWVQVFGSEGDWLLVQYNAANECNRFAYIPKDALPAGIDVPALAWADELHVLTIGQTLTVDPLRGGKPHGDLLKAGTQVTYLASLGTRWAYVQYGRGDHEMRGFVLKDYLVPRADAPKKADEAAALAERWVTEFGDKYALNMQFANDYRSANENPKPYDDPEALNERVPEVLAAAINIILKDFDTMTAEMLAKDYEPYVEYQPYGMEDEDAWAVSISPFDMNDLNNRHLEPFWLIIDGKTLKPFEINHGYNG